MGPGTDKVARPDMIAMLRTQPNTRSIIEPQSPSWLLLLWNLQPFATPDTLNSILAYWPAGALQQRRDPAIAIATILAGQLNNGPGQLIFIFTMYRNQPLRASGLIDQSARTSLTDSMRLLRIMHRASSPLRA